MKVSGAKIKRARADLRMARVIVTCNNLGFPLDMEGLRNLENRDLTDMAERDATILAAAMSGPLSAILAETPDVIDAMANELRWIRNRLSRDLPVRSTR